MKDRLQRWFARLPYQQQKRVCVAMVAVNALLWGTLGWWMATGEIRLWDIPPAWSAALFAALSLVRSARIWRETTPDCR